MKPREVYSTWLTKGRFLDWTAPQNVVHLKHWPPCWLAKGFFSMVEESSGSANVRCTKGVDVDGETATAST